MSDAPERKPYDLETRTRAFAKKVRAFLKALPAAIARSDDAKQLIRSSGSVGENLIEAAESLGPKDRRMHMRISRKEARESEYWLDLIDTAELPGLDPVRRSLQQEATELTKIFGRIVRDMENDAE
jgi:four helix bundle protein